MKVLSIAVLALAGLSALASAAPRVVAPESVFDAGAAVKGEVVRHAFAIRNEGDEPLEIAEVRPACGCTVAEFDETIGPGAEGTVVAEVDTTNFSGPIAKALTVFTNDPDTPRLQLTVKARVEPLIVVEPGYARFTLVEGDPAATSRQLLWASDGSDDFRIIKVTSPREDLEVAFAQVPDGEGSSDGEGPQWAVDLEMAASGGDTGPIAGYVTVETNHPRAPKVSIPVSGFVRPEIAVSPRLADFGEISGDEVRKTSIMVLNYSQNPVRVTGVESTLSGIETEINELEAGRRYQILLTLGEGRSKGVLDGTIEIATDSERTPSLEISVRASII